MAKQDVRFDVDLGVAKEENYKRYPRFSYMQLLGDAADGGRFVSQWDTFSTKFVS